MTGGENMQYTTVKGDTFDTIAYKQYGNEELIKPIIDANPQYAETAVFDFGSVLEIPELDKADDTLFLPPWRART